MNTEREVNWKRVAEILADCAVSCPHVALGGCSEDCPTCLMSWAISQVEQKEGKEKDNAAR